MEREWHGHWWLPRDAEARVPGRLVVSADGSVRLELTGGLALSEIGDDSTADLILGYAEETDITLLRCFVMTSRPGLIRVEKHYQRLHANRALIGTHVGPADAVFESVRAQFEHLTTWLAAPTVEHTQRLGDNKYQATVEDAPPKKVAFDGWTATVRTLVQPFEVTNSRRRDIVTSEVATYLYLQPSEPTMSTGFDELLLAVMDLLTLASGEASGLIDSVMTHEERRTFSDRDGSTYQLPVTVESLGRRTHTASPDEPAVPDHRFRFTCRDLPFEELLPRWVSLRQRTSAACNVFFGLSYARPVYTETRLLLTAIAAEELHKSLVPNLKSGKTNFKYRMLALAELAAPEAVGVIIDDVESWATRITRARHGLAHSGNDTRDDDIFHLESMTVGLISLVLMSELGLPADVQVRAAKWPLLHPFAH